MIPTLTTTKSLKETLLPLPTSALPRRLSFFSVRKKLQKRKRPNEEVVAKEGKHFEQ
jgi:hypothetical protein